MLDPARRLARRAKALALRPLDLAARLAETVGVALRLRREGRPIVIFQMGKVGSRTLYFGLRAATARPVFHVHNLRPGTPELGHELVRRAVIAGGRSADFVVPVRDPIARAVSTFFELAPPDPGQPLDLERETRRFLDDAPQDSVLWFERHLRPVFGLDVYAAPFDGACATLAAEGGHRVLLLRAELADALKAQALAGFLEMAPPALPRVNETQAKGPGDHYARFVAEAPLPPPYVELVYATRFARHFYSDAERLRLHEHWSSCPRPRRHPLVDALAP